MKKNKMLKFVLNGEKSITFFVKDYHRDKNPFVFNKSKSDIKTLRVHACLYYFHTKLVIFWKILLFHGGSGNGCWLSIKINTN